MEEIAISKGYSVGLFNFGMKKEEVEHYNKVYIEKYNCYDDSFFFEYDENEKVINIHLVIDALKHNFQCNFMGIDMFNTKAKELIEFFGNITPFIRNQESSLGYSYQFPELGLAFWRGTVFNEKDIESDWFKELLPEIQEDNKRFLYFETLTFYEV